MSRNPVALVLASGLAVGFATALILLATPWTKGLNDRTIILELLATLGGAMAGAVAAYLGGQGRGTVEETPDTEHTEPASEYDKPGEPPGDEPEAEPASGPDVPESEDVSEEGDHASSD